MSIQITTNKNITATKGERLVFQLQVTGGRYPYTWVSLKDLPKKLKLGPAGVLKGYPQVTGTFKIPIKVVDDLGNFDKKVFNLTIEPKNNVLGTLWGWGANGSGQLGDETTDDKSSPVQTICGGSNWVDVACGYYTAIAIKNDGTLWSWGDNNHGSIGDETTDDKSSPVQTICGGNNWAKVASGCYWDHNFAIKTDGTLWGWGYNSNGELGCGDTDNRSSPIQTIVGGTDWLKVSSGGRHTAAIKTDGSLWVWGDNDYGQLGDNTTDPVSSPIQTITGGYNWVNLACGERFMAAIKDNGTLWMWGQNGDGQLGLNDTDDRSSPIQTFIGGTDWKKVSCGNNHIAVIKNDGTLWTWGDNSDGQLGTGDTDDRSSPVQTVCGGSNWKHVSCGQNNTAAIKNDGTLWVWGYNSNGELGDNATVDKSSPVQTVMGGNKWVYVWSGYVNTFAIESV